MADEVGELLRTLRTSLRNIWTEFTIKSIKGGSPVRASDIAGAVVVSGTVFPLCIGCLQNAVFRPLRLTSHRRAFGPVFGGLSVAVSSAVTSMAFVLYVAVSKGVSHRYFEAYKRRVDSAFPQFQFSYSSYDVVLYTLGSMAMFKGFGGRFSSVLPSSLVHPGAFARAFIPAPSKLYASDTTRQKLTKLGKKFGCHSCGKRRWRCFVGDHIPPNKLVKPGEIQKFYPQCTTCSSKQGAALATNSRKLVIRSHATSLRCYHIWIPLPTLLIAARNYFVERSKELKTADEVEKDEEDKEQETNLKSLLLMLGISVGSQMKDKESDETEKNSK